MKILTLTILLISVNVFAEYKCEFTETATGGKYTFEKPANQEVLDRLEEIILKSQWMQCNWQLDQVDTYASKVFTTTEESGTEDIEVPTYDELGAPIVDENGDSVTEIVSMPVFIEVDTTKYCAPANFTVNITDITQEKADKAAAKQARSDRKATAKTIKDTGKKWKQLSDQEKDDVMAHLMDVIGE